MTVVRSTSQPKPPAAQPQAAPGALINRTLVAGALDRQGPKGAPDGVISREELREAGITQLDPRAIAAINEGGEAGDALTVSEVAKALASDRVAIVGTGLVTIENGRATLPNGQVVPSGPWQFPEVADLQFLEAFERLIPRLSRYNPSSPDGAYVDRVYSHTERVQVGTRRVYDGKDANGHDKYREEPVYEDRRVYKDEIQYDRLLRDLRRRADEVLASAPEAQDPALKSAIANLRAVADKSAGFWGHESRCREIYNALRGLDRIERPRRPETLAGELNATLDKALAQVDEQARIARDVPLDKARTAIGAEVKRLKAPSLANFLSGGLGAAAGGAAAFFGLGAALAGAPLIGAAAGAAVVAGGIGWLIAQLIKGGQAKGLERDLQVLQAIDPVGNRKALEQHAFAAYALLQDARKADFLAALRAFESDAKKLAVGMDDVARCATEQTQSLRTVESWVLKYQG